MSKEENAIPVILKIERGVTAHIGDYLKEEDLNQVTILFGNGLTDMFGDTVLTSCKKAGVEVAMLSGVVAPTNPTFTSPKSWTT